MDSFICVDCGCEVYQFPVGVSRGQMCAICVFINDMPEPERARLRTVLRAEREAGRTHAENPR